MKSAFKLLSAVFRLLILKPFDYLLFGGCGVLTIPRNEWQNHNIVPDTPSSATRCTGQLQDDYQPDEAQNLIWFNTRLPTVYDGPEGDSFFMDIEK